MINEGPENRGGAGHPVRTPSPEAPQPRPTLRVVQITEASIREHMKGVCKKVAPDATSSFMAGVIYTTQYLKEIGLI
jgi:hypothetical protein